MSSPERKKPTARAVRLFWMSALCIIVIFGLYRIIVQLVDNGKLGEVWFSVMMWAFMIAASALFIAIVVLQRGFSGKPVSADELPDTMSIDEKRAYCESAFTLGCRATKRSYKRLAIFGFRKYV